MNSFHKRQPLIKSSHLDSSTNMNSHRSLYHARKNNSIDDLIGKTAETYEDTGEKHVIRDTLMPTKKAISTAISAHEEIDELCDGEKLAQIELEHMIGFSGTYSNVILRHPHEKDSFVFPVSNVLVMGSLSDPHKQYILHGHTNEISSLAVSKSGRFIVSGQRNSSSMPLAQLRLWSFATHNFVTSLGSLSETVRALCFSDDEQWLACSSEENILRIWNISTGDLIAGIKTSVSAMVFGKCVPGRSRRNPTYTLYTVSNQGNAMINAFSYDVKTMQYGSSAHRCEVPPRAIIRRAYTCCVLDASKLFLLCGSAAGDVSVYNVVQGVFCIHFSCCSNGVHSLCEMASLIYVGGGDGSVSVFGGFDQGWSLQRRTKLHGQITTISPAPDFSNVIVGTDTGRLYQLPSLTHNNNDSLQHTAPSLLNSQQFVMLSQSPTLPVRSVAFGVRSDRFATIGDSGRLSLWDLSDYTEIMHVQGLIAGVLVQFDANDDSNLLSGWNDGSLRSHNAASGVLNFSLSKVVRGGLSALAQHERVFAVAGSNSGCIQIIDRKSHLVLFEYIGHTRAPISALHYDCNNSNLLHSCGGDKRRVTYDMKRRIFVAGNQVNNGSFTASDQKKTGEFETISTLSDGRIIVHDVDLPDPVFIFEELLDPVRSTLQSKTTVAISPSSRYVVSADAAGVVALYEIQLDAKGSVSNVMLLMSKRVHSSSIRCVQWTPDEKQLISVGDDSCICVWNFYVFNE